MKMKMKMEMEKEMEKEMKMKMKMKMRWRKSKEVKEGERRMRIGGKRMPKQGEIKKQKAPLFHGKCFCIFIHFQPLF